MLPATHRMFLCVVCIDFADKQQSAIVSSHKLWPQRISPTADYVPTIFDYACCVPVVRFPRHSSATTKRCSLTFTFSERSRWHRDATRTQLATKAAMLGARV
jgi:hypothetical protein